MPRRLGGVLRGALAHTAAIGETCHVAFAAEAVRLAVGDLEMGLLSDARDKLHQALDALATSVRPVRPRPIPARRTVSPRYSSTS